MDWGEIYEVGAYVTWVIVFLCVWIGCALEYGFLGFALAWMPAAIVATVLAFLWPMIVILVFVVGFKMWK